MSVRLNIVIDEHLYRRLKDEVPPKRLSAFINDAVRARLTPDRDVLDAAYRAASRETWRREVAEDWRATDTEDWPA
jgi:hypothetical protein